MADASDEAKAAAVEGQLVSSINDTASYCRTLWVTFISYMAAIFILVGGTTHDDLLRETPVKMPLFELGVPLLLFYLIAPLLLVLFHLNLLLKLHDLRRRVGAIAGTMTDDAARDLLRRRLMAFDYALLSGGLVADSRERRLLSVVTNATIFVMPLGLLLFTQLQFLPYHDWRMTWAHRALFILDLVLIYYIHFRMRRAAAARSPIISKPLRANSPYSGGRGLAAAGATLQGVALAWRGATALFAVAVSLVVFAYPDEPVTDVFWPMIVGDYAPGASDGRSAVLAGRDPAESLFIVRSLSLPNRQLWAKEPPPEILAVYESHRGIAPTGTPVETTASTPATAPAKDPRIEAERRYGAAMNLNGRNLSYANLGGVSLIDAKLHGADLHYATLSGAQLTGADLSDATLNGANLSYTQLQGASLERVQARGADFERAQAFGVSFEGAFLEGAYFRQTTLDLANLGGAQLQASYLRFTSLQGAVLIGADLSGAVLFVVDLRAADLSYATLRGALISTASIWGADFAQTQLSLAEFLDSELNSKSSFDLLRQQVDAMAEGENHQILAQLLDDAQSRAATDGDRFRDTVATDVWNPAPPASGITVPRSAIAKPQYDSRLKAFLLQLACRGNDDPNDAEDSRRATADGLASYRAAYSRYAVDSRFLRTPPHIDPPQLLESLLADSCARANLRPSMIAYLEALAAKARPTK